MSNARIIAELRLATLALHMGLPPAKPVHTEHGATLTVLTGAAQAKPTPQQVRA